MPKRPKRVLSAEYREGAQMALDFLRAEERLSTDPWIFAERFTRRADAMKPESAIGFRDAVFLFIQCTLQDAPANLDGDGDTWLLDLEDPDRWMEDEHA